MEAIKGFASFGCGILIDQKKNAEYLAACGVGHNLPAEVFLHRVSLKMEVHNSHKSLHVSDSF